MSVGFPLPSPGSVFESEGGGGGGSDDQTAAEVPFSPAGNIAATDTQAAIEELDSEKAASGHNHDSDYAELEMSRTITVTSPYTLVAGDAGKIIDATFGTDGTVTVPPNGDVAFPLGTVVNVLQAGAGQVTIAPGSGVTLNNANGLKTASQWSMLSLWKRTTDTWVVTGDATV